MDLSERDRLITVTRGFQGLQGLLYAPIGIWNLAFALVPPGHLAAGGVVLAFFPCAIAASLLARSYYRRRFGVVRSAPGSLYRLLAVVVAIVTMIGAVYLDGGFFGPLATSHPISALCLWWALFYLACFLCPYGVRLHSLLFAAIFAGLCVLTSMGVVPKSQFYWESGPGHAGNVFIWLALSLHGLLDHVLLLRLLPKASPAQATSPSEQPHE